MTNSQKEIFYDLYDRPTIIKIDENNEKKEIVFTYQAQNDKINSGTYVGYMDESPLLANVKSLYDGYSNLTTEFEYDMYNSKIGITVKDANSNVKLKVKRENAVETTYEVGGIVTKTNKAYEGNPKQFANLDKEGNKLNKFTYTYETNDVIGAIEKRSGGNSQVEYSFEHTDNASYYSIYTYDNLNRIYKEGHTGAKVDFEYQYNEFNRLSAVKRNGSIDKTFNYDELGKITKYYKNGSLTKEYSYSGANLNPSIIYHNGQTKICTFKGEGQLVQYGINSYQYDVSGLRTSKACSYQMTKYYYQGNKLLGEDLPNGEKLRYMYDSVDYLDIENIGGLNLYCYCKNNPVMYYDPEGHFFLTSLLISVGIGALVGVISTGVADVLDDGKLFNGSQDWRDYLGAGVAGAIGGLAGEFGLNMVGSIVLSSVGDLIGSAIAGDINSWKDVGITLGLSIGIGIFSCGFSKAFGDFVGNKQYSKIRNYSKNNTKVNKMLSNKNGTYKALTKLKIGSNSKEQFMKALSQTWDNTLAQSIGGGIITISVGSWF